MSNKSTFYDLVFNYCALFIGGVSGIIINICISYNYGPEGLGIFNQVYAFYVILSQLSVGGIHLSALRHIAIWQGSSASLSKIAWSSFLISLPISGSFSILCYFSSFPLQAILSSSQVGQGIRYASFALVFFSCNKVMLFILNALHEMKIFAFLQGARFILMIFFVILLIHLKVTSSALGLIFPLSEGALFVGLLFTTLYKIPYINLGLNKKWMRKHFLFGLQGFCNGLLLELNTRVDILLLGIFTNDITVGLYSFASMLIEGILGFLVVIRNQINPILARCLKEGRQKDIKFLF